MFNLIDEPWIPVASSNVSSKLASISDVLLKPHRWSRIQSINPIECLALHRLLLAICHRAIGPGDLSQRIALIDDWPNDQISSYLDLWRHRFELHDPQRPFLQYPGLADAGAKPKPWTILCPDRASGSNRVFWDHSTDSDIQPISRAEAAVALIAHLQFAPCGLVKFLRTSASASPSTGPLLVIPTGNTLQETFVLSLVEQTAAEFEIDLPGWEVPLPSITELEKPTPFVIAGPAQRYTFMPRMVELLPAAQITHVFYAPGFLPADSPIPDPMTAVVIRENGLQMPLMLNQNKAIWRDLHALIGAEGSHSPETVSNAASIQDQRGIFEPIQLTAGGLMTDKAKFLAWRLEFRNISPRLLSQQNAIYVVEKLLQTADLTGKLMRKALWALFSNWLSHNGTGSSPETSSVRGMLDSTQVMTHFWAALESDFWSLVNCLGSGVDGDEILSRWNTTLSISVSKTWDQAREYLGLDSRALMAAAQSSAALGRALKPLQTSLSTD